MVRWFLAAAAVVATSLGLAASAPGITSNGTYDGNTHPNVGAMVYLSPSTGLYRIICSGSLIAPTVFLTASHCTAALEARGISDVWVTFDPTFTQASPLIHGTMHTNPLYNQKQGDPGDIAVITLDNPAGAAPVQLPTLGLLDSMKKAGTLNGTFFTSVGYGSQEAENGPGGQIFPFLGQRWYTSGEFNALNDVWLRISQNQATGDGGTCYGDSGGPEFLGAGRSEQPIQVSLTVTGDTPCNATNVDYRVDTPQARAFLDDYVALP
jgi:secreted trypsin-like serine protease